MQLVKGLGLGRSKYFDWRRRHGKVNGHNAWIARGHWLEDWEKEAIVAHYPEHQDDGYRRLTHMLLDEDIAAAVPAASIASCWARIRCATGIERPRRKRRVPGNP